MRVYRLSLVLVFVQLLSLLMPLAAQSSQAPELILTKDSLLVKYSIPGAGDAEYILSLNPSFIKFFEIEYEVKYKLASFRFKEEILMEYHILEVDSINQTDSLSILSGRLFNSNGQSKRLEVSFGIGQYKDLEIHINAEDKAINCIELGVPSYPEQSIYGFGEQYAYLDRKGHQFALFTEEQGLGKGDQPVSRLARLGGSSGDPYTSYAPIPFFLTSDNTATFLDTYAYIECDLKDDKNSSFRIWSNELQMHVWKAETVDSLLFYHSAMTGRMPVLPEWAFGTWIGVQGGREKAERIVQECLDAGNPVTALWIQDWVGRRKTRFGSQLWWLWNANEDLYPDFRAFCEGMEKKGVKVLGYINSFLAIEGPMYEEAKSLGFLVRNREGEDYEIQTAGFPAVLIDLTNPAARNWLKKIIQENLIGMGLSGWMADYGEWLPPDAIMYSGASGLDYHNEYAVEWARLNLEAIAEAGREHEIIFFTRAGNARSAAYSTMFWQGDQMISWQKFDGLPSTVPALISSGLSGITMNHSDIGGYTTISFPFVEYVRDPELLFRWIELNAFTPVFRTHEGLKPSINHQFYTDDKSMEFFAFYGQLHHALKDYFLHLNKEAAEKGMPVVRHMSLVDPSINFIEDFDYQFCLGHDLLVCPVLKPSQDNKQCYLPAGNWEHLWTGVTFSGPKWISVESPVGEIPVFLRTEGVWYDKLKVELLDVISLKNRD